MERNVLIIFFSGSYNHCTKNNAQQHNIDWKSDTDGTIILLRVIFSIFSFVLLGKLNIPRNIIPTVYIHFSKTNNVVSYRLKNSTMQIEKSLSVALFIFFFFLRISMHNKFGIIFCLKSFTPFFRLIFNVCVQFKCRYYTDYYLSSKLFFDDSFTQIIWRTR